MQQFWEVKKKKRLTYNLTSSLLSSIPTQLCKEYIAFFNVLWNAWDILKWGSHFLFGSFYRDYTAYTLQGGCRTFLLIGSQNKGEKKRSFCLNRSFNGWYSCTWLLFLYKIHCRLRSLLGVLLHWTVREWSITLLTEFVNKIVINAITHF